MVEGSKVPTWLLTIIETVYGLRIYTGVCIMLYKALYMYNNIILLYGYLHNKSFVVYL